uniref:Uncharacterized protein n=2 Tax=Lutzomyia longipalpis TaxID=7200 RepID=A0A1B0GI35_LUTLO
MGKKGTKKKTKWHSLPMEAISGAAAETHGIHREQTTAVKPSTNAWRLPPTKSSSISSQNSNQSADNPQSSEITSTTHLNGHHEHHPRSTGHRRRNYQQNSYHGRHFGRRSSPSYRCTYSGQNANSRDNAKPAFNEDEYTRITTPRQDVLFKKGYLSRPKRFNSFAGPPNDPATTPPSSGSGAMSVTSMDDSATPSTQSISPEHYHSASDASDGDYPFMYPGFFDQNGVLYVNQQTTAVKPSTNAWRLPPTKSSSISSQNSNQSADNPQSSEITSTTHLNGHHEHHPRSTGHRRRNYQQNSYHGRHFGHEYTRITTPRQDVLFKKGYLSRPKRFNSFAGPPNDPATTPPSSGSGAMSVTSMDDSATPSTQSISPEHYHSASDASDGDYPFMYPGFFDQNGVLYVNPYTSFDPYGNAPMMMMPYPVNNLNSMDMYNTPVTPYDASCSSVDSQITSPGTASPHNEESTPETPPIVEENATAIGQEDDAQEGDVKSPTLNPNSTNFYPQSIPPFYPPPIYYAPYVFSPPMVPIYSNGVEYSDAPGESECAKTKEEDGQEAAEASNSLDAVDQAVANQTGQEAALSESQAEQESSSCCHEEEPTEAQKNNVIPIEDMSVPIKSTLNVEVQEFHPRNYSQRHQTEDVQRPRDIDTAENAKENNSKAPKGTTKKEAGSRKKQAYSQIITNRKLLQEATKSIQAQNIDLSKENPLAVATTTTVAAAETKWQTVVKPRGKKGRSVAIEDAADEDEATEATVQTEEVAEQDTVQESLLPIPEEAPCATAGKMPRKAGKPKKKASGACKKGRKQKTTNGVGFEVIEPDFGRIVLNKKTEIVSEEDSEVDGATQVVEDNVIDVCDDAECRKLEAELQNIECILNLAAYTCSEDSPVKKEKLTEVTVNGHAELDEVESEEEERTEAIKEACKEARIEAINEASEEQCKEGSEGLSKEARKQVIMNECEAERQETNKKARKDEVNNQPVDQAKEVSQAIDSEQAKAVEQAKAFEQAKAVAQAIGSEQAKAVTQAIGSEQAKAVEQAIDSEQANDATPTKDAAQTNEVDQAKEQTSGLILTAAAKAEASEKVAEDEDTESISELSDEITEIDIGSDAAPDEATVADQPKHDERRQQEEEKKTISLYEAVTLWLDEKQKTNSAEDLFRLPEIPVVLQRFYETAAPDIDTDATDQSDTEDEAEANDASLEPQLKLKNQVSVSEDDSVDTDSDYQSDGQTKRPTYTLPSDSQATAELTTTGSPTNNKLTSVNTLNHSSSIATLEAKTSPISCILM